MGERGGLVILGPGWRVLLRAVGLSVSPGRVVLGVIGVLAGWAALMWWDFLVASAGAPGVEFDVERWLPGAMAEPGRLAAETLWSGASEADASVLTRVWYAVLGLVVLLAVWMVVGLGIARSAGAEASRGMRVGMVGSASWGARRAVGAFGLATLPFLVPVASLAVLTVLGLVARWAGGLESLIGAALAGPMALIAFAGAALWASGVLMAPMLPGALAIEETDALDAVQRCGAYVLGSPGRWLVSLIVVWAPGVAAWVIVGVLADAAEVLVVAAGSGGLDGFGTVGWATAKAVLHFAILGWALSLTFCAGTVQYLHLRRVVDGEEVERRE